MRVYLLTILLRVEVLESLLSDVGSKDASGELLGEPVDIGDGEAGAGAGQLGTVGAVGASSRSRNGFLLLLGEEKGLVRPIVANFCPELKGLFSSCVWAAAGARSGAAALGGELGGTLGAATKFAVKGLVLAAVAGAAAGVSTPAVPAVPAAGWRKVSEKSVSRWSPASPFSEKCVTLMGSETLEGESGVSRLEMVSRSAAGAGADTVVVVRVGALSTSIS